MTERTSPLPWRRPQRRTVAVLGLVGVLVASGVAVMSLSAGDRVHAVVETVPVQRGWGLYLGSVTGVTVGVATNGRTVQAFARNADASEVSWFDGTLAGNSFDITSTNGTVLAGGVVGGNARGRYVTKSGAVVPFDVPAPVAKGALYRGAVVAADGTRVDAGWVVDESGAVTGGVVVTSSKGPKSLATKPITAIALETAGTADTGSGVVPLRRVQPDTLDAPVPTALTGASLGNRPGRPVIKDEISPTVKVGTLAEPPKSTLSAMSAALTGPASVQAGASFELKLTMTNPDPVIVDGAAIDVGFPSAFTMGDRPDELIPQGCADISKGDATTVDDDDVTRNGSQLLARNIRLSAGGSCGLAIDLNAKEPGVYEIVTSGARAPGRPAGPSARLTVTVVAPKVPAVVATAGDPPAVPNGICAAPPNTAEGRRPSSPT